jgi:transposase
MAKHRCYSIEFKRQVAQEYLAGDTLHGLAKRHDISRNLIRVWVAKYEAGGFDDDARAADLLQERRRSPPWSVWSAARRWSSSF